MFEALALFAFLMQEAWWDARAASATWAGERHEAILEAAFPMDDYATVRARTYQDLYWDEPESWFCLDDRRDGLVAEVRLPANSSVIAQVADPWMVNRSATLEELLSRVDLERITYRGSNCPAIADALEALSQIEAKALDTDPQAIVLHPRLFEVRTVTYEVTQTFQIQQEHALAKWHLATLVALLDCPESSREIVQPPITTHLCAGSITH